MRSATRGISSSTDLAGQIKERLTMDEVARHYGFSPNRSGFMRCPFHHEKTASVKIYSDEGGWHCFGCGKGGSVIDFVMRLYDINFRQACLRLNMDFGLGLEDQKPDPAARSAELERRRQEQRRRQELEAEYWELAAEHRYFWQISIHFRPESKDRETGFIHPLYAEAVNKLPWLEWRLDELEGKLRR